MTSSKPDSRRSNGQVSFRRNLSRIGLAYLAAILTVTALGVVALWNYQRQLQLSDAVQAAYEATLETPEQPKLRLLSAESKSVQEQTRWLLICGLAATILILLGSATVVARDMRRRFDIERELDAFFSHSLDMFCLANFAGYFTRVNPQMQKVLGYSEAELTSSPYESFLHPDDVAATTNATETLESGEPVLSFVNRYRRKDGEYRWLSWRARAAVAEGVIYAVARDVTDQRRLEEELVRARRLAEGASQAKSDFLANMSHEIRTPLNAIIGMSEVLAESVHDAEQRKFIRVLRSAGNSLLFLINNILDIAKIEAGKLEIQRSDFALQEVLDTTVDMLSFRASQKGVTLVVDFDSALPEHAHGDPSRLRQILVNLIANAIKFTQVGTIRLSARAAGNGEVTFAVSDSGIGIAPEKQSLVFQRFEQSSGTAEESRSGTGLGLHISKQLVELMGGKIWFASKQGEGTTFSFRIPLPAGNATTSSPTIAIEAGAVAARLLIVDDNEDNRLLAATYLRKTPFVLDFATNGLEALELVKQHQYGVILMDMHMPVMDGYDAVRAIRAWESEKGLPPHAILALTAYALKEEAERSRVAGCDGHLTKPITKFDLLHAIRGQLGAAGSAPAHATPAAGPVAAPVGPVAAPTEEAAIYAEPDAEVADLAEGYLERRRKDLPGVLDLLAKRDFAALKTAAHNVKGTAKVYGFGPLGEISGKLEIAAESSNADACRECLVAYGDYLAKVKLRAPKANNS